MTDEADSKYLHGMLDGKYLGKPEDILKKPVVEILGREVEVVDLTNWFGAGVPLWPYFADVKIDRVHYHAKSRVLSQYLTHTMHVSTHADSPVHVEEGYPFTDQIPLERYMGKGVEKAVENVNRLLTPVNRKFGNRKILHFNH